MLTREEALALASRVTDVRVETSLVDYVLDLVERTRDGRRFLLGLSTRAAQAMYRAAQARALLEGRDYCVPDDVKALAVPVFAHRIVPVPTGSSGTDVEALVREIVDGVPVPA